jgi:ribose transport system permease protein
MSRTEASLAGTGKRAAATHGEPVPGQMAGEPEVAGASGGGPAGGGPGGPAGGGPVGPAVASAADGESAGPGTLDAEPGRAGRPRRAGKPGWRPGRLLHSAEFLAFVFLVAICAALWLSRATFMTEFNIQNVGRQTSVLLVLSVGLLFVLLSGGIDLSVGGQIAFGGVIAASLAAYMPPGWAFAVAIGCAALVGLVNGLLVGVAGFSPIVVTLAVGQVLSGVALLLTKTGPIQPVNPAYSDLATAMAGPVPMIVVAAAVCVLVAHGLLGKTALGRYIYATGGNETAAWLAGISTARVKIAAYTICGAFAGIAGVLASAQIDSGDASIGASTLLEGFAAVFLGGVGFGTAKGKVAGVVCGALILGVISNGLDLFQLDSSYQYIVSGAVIVLAIAIQVLPGKLAGRRA